jgi:molybdate transport system ATP-binding protein
MSLELELRHEGPRLDFAAAIPPGRITALLGPSGSGKTSILRAIAGLLRLRHELVRVQGELWSDSTRGLRLPTRLRPVGMVPQHYALFPHLTALGNVEMALQQLPAAARGQRARQCLALAQVEELAGRYPREISGGQRQRVALARAIAREPKLLLLDEPFSAVDRSTKKSLYVEIMRLHQALKATVVVVTHDLDEAAQLASHLCLLHRGRLLQSGPTAEVLERPGCEEAARMLDIPNIFDGRIERDGRRVLLRWGPHALRLSERGAAPPAGVLRWAIQPANVLMVRPDKPWDSHLENPVPTRVTERIEVGNDTLVWLAPAGIEGARLQMRLPARALRRYAIEPGQEITVCLRGADIVPLRPPPVPAQG